MAVDCLTLNARSKAALRSCWRETNPGADGPKWRAAYNLLLLLVTKYALQSIPAKMAAVDRPALTAGTRREVNKQPPRDDPGLKILAGRAGILVCNQRERKRTARSELQLLLRRGLAKL